MPRYFEIINNESSTFTTEENLEQFNKLDDIDDDERTYCGNKNQLRNLFIHVL